ncbi:MAG TPA: YncE family protein [Usitatibacter sp.]|nr:YncE family protein [Usitatibacter sp.]
MHAHLFRAARRLASSLVALLLSVGVPVFAAPFAFLVQADGNSVAVVDLASRSIVATIPVTRNPAFIAANPAGTRMYVSSISDPAVSVIDTASRSVVTTITTPAVAAGVAVNPAGTRMAIALPGGGATPLNTVGIYDAATNGLLQTVTSGAGPTSVAFNPSGTRLYVANSDANTISVIDGTTFAVVATVPTQPTPFPMAVNPAGTRLYVSQLGTQANAANSVAVIDLASNAVLAQIAVGSLPAGVAVRPSGDRVFVALPEAGAVAVIDAGANTVATRITTGGFPTSVGVTPDGTQLVVVDGDNDRILVYDTTTLAQVFVMTVPNGPVALGGSFIVGAASTGTPNPPGARSGLWWNPNESGWGIHFTQRGNIIFAAWYTYDASGAPKWYVASSCAVVGNSCSGSLFQATGPRFFGVPFNPSSASVSNAGSLAVTFSSNESATMTYSVAGQSRTVPIVRQVFRGTGTTPAVSYTDLWWNASESGWGMAITQQFQTMFLAWFVYNSAGQPVWYVVSDCAVTAGGNGCSGSVFRTTGPPFGPTFNPSLISVFPAGSATLTFSDANNGTLSFTVDGVSGSKSITRQVF